MSKKKTKVESSTTAGITGHFMADPERLKRARPKTRTKHV
jgi:hypothetical protein